MDNLLGETLGFQKDDKIVLTMANWTEARGIQFQEQPEIQMRQCREKGGKWVLTEFISPEITSWFWTVRNATNFKLQTPSPAWLGPVNDIPEDILLGDQPVMIRCTNRQGWYNLRMVIKSSCETEA
jgi:hypothetical protein